MHSLHISGDRQNYLEGTEFEMSYTWHDLIYIHSMIHEDLLNVGLNFHGPKENNLKGFCLYRF